jgi:hypothetical protein
MSIPSIRYHHPVMDESSPVINPATRRIIGHVTRPTDAQPVWLVTARDGKTLARLTARPAASFLSLLFKD